MLAPLGRAAASVIALRARGRLLTIDGHPDLPDPCENDLAFVRRYGLTIRGQPFDFDRGYKHMVEPFEDDHPDQVLMAGAQTGKTIRLMARLARSALRHPGSLLGYYFPDLHLPSAFSRERFAPFIKSSAELRVWLGKDADMATGTDQVLTRTMGPSVFYFLSTRGKSMTEGLPMKGVFFDELRRMEAGDVQRAEERISAQQEPLTMKVSTAHYPDSDIHAAFMAGDQRYFHTACSCPDGVVLALTFPNCMMDLRRATPETKARVNRAFAVAGVANLGMTEQQRKKYGDACYVCPKCGDVIADPREGWWEAHNPGAWVHSYQMPQLLSPTYPASRALRKYDRPTEPVDQQELWNSMVGLPYIDVQNQPVQIEHLKACVSERASWAVLQSEAWRRKWVSNTAMGIDAMGGFNCVVIKQMAKDGKFRTIHLEVVHGDDPWKECARMMERFDVRVCVADCNPHWNEAHRFAKAFEGRVWLAVYVDNASRAPMVDWKDRVKAAVGQRKAGDDAKMKYMVNLNRTRALAWSLGRWALRRNETPNPVQLMQALPRQGGKVILTAGLRVGHFEPTPICRDVYWVHQQSVIFRKVYANDEAKRTGQFKVTAEHVGLDPHFAHANLYADVALSRIGRPSRPRALG